MSPSTFDPSNWKAKVGLGVVILAGGAAGATGWWHHNDTSPPKTAITAPSDGATVSGTTSISADCSDNEGVKSVQFSLNGSALGSAITSRPYTVSWDTSQYSAGTYTLGAVCRDTSGNTTSAATTSAVITPAGSPGFVANVFVAPIGTVGATSSCVASSSPISYATAIAANNVCVGDGSNFTGLDKACLATQALSAASGATVGVKGGSYTSLASGAIMGQESLNGEDCSGGKGGNYNPTFDISKPGDAQPIGAGNTNGWVTFSCADGDSGTVNYDSFSGAMFRASNFHAKLVGGCFRFNSPLLIGAGGDGTNVRNLWFEGTSRAAPLYVWSYLVKGGTNIYFKWVSDGPSYLCGKSGDANVNASVQCNPSGQWWESHYANYGTTNNTCGNSTYQANCGGSFSATCGVLGSSENYVNNGDNGTLPIVRFDHLYTHDQQSPVSTNLSCVHSGGLLMQDQNNYPANSVVFDDWTCERTGVFCAEIHSGGVTIQNSTFAPAINLGSPSTTWAPTLDANILNFGRCDSGTCSVAQTGILIRHIDCTASTTGSCFAFSATNGNTYSNFRIITSILGRNPRCPTTGVTYDSNMYLSSTGYTGGCDSNATTSFGGNPWTDSDPGTTLPSLANVFNSQLDMTLTGSPAAPTVGNNGSPNSDYTLDHDNNGNSRSTTTHAGATG